VSRPRPYLSAQSNFAGKSFVITYEILSSYGAEERNCREMSHKVARSVKRRAVILVDAQHLLVAHHLHARRNFQKSATAQMTGTACQHDSRCQGSHLSTVRLTLHELNQLRRRPIASFVSESYAGDS